MMYVEFMNIFLLALIERADGCWSHFGLLSPKTLDSYFLDIMGVEFKKNFLLAHSRELMAVRFILASLAKKRLIPNFLI